MRGDKEEEEEEEGSLTRVNCSYNKKEMCFCKAWSLSKKKGGLISKGGLVSKVSLRCAKVQ